MDHQLNKWTRAHWQLVSSKLGGLTTPSVQLTIGIVVAMVEHVVLSLMILATVVLQLTDCGAITIVVSDLVVRCPRTRLAVATIEPLHIALAVLLGAESAFRATVDVINTVVQSHVPAPARLHLAFVEGTTLVPI